MLAEAEDGWTVRGLVTSNALKHRAAVADNVRQDVDFGVVPRDELAVMPDLGGGRHSLSIT